jgi:hypothetical protein
MLGALPSIQANDIIAWVTTTWRRPPTNSQK